MTITPIRPEPTTTPAGRADRQPIDAELFPYLDQVDVCIYCGRFQTEEEAQERTADHVRADLLAVHRASDALVREFGIPHPGYGDDVYDLLCDLDAADKAENGVA